MGCGTSRATTDSTQEPSHAQAATAGNGVDSTSDVHVSVDLTLHKADALRKTHEQNYEENIVDPSSALCETWSEKTDLTEEARNKSTEGQQM